MSFTTGVGLAAGLLFGIAAVVAAEDPAANARGKAVYKQANCVGCHKWHGGGGGSYGGAALSLRETRLASDALKLVVRCGRPGTHMPFHARTAYRAGNRDCYATTRSELGEAAPPRARELLSEQQIDAVVAYVVAEIQGKGEPDYADCVAFWGRDARQCGTTQP